MLQIKDLYVKHMFPKSPTLTEPRTKLGKEAISILTRVRLPSKPASELSNGPNLLMHAVCALVL